MVLPASLPPVSRLVPLSIHSRTKWQINDHGNDDDDRRPTTTKSIETHNTLVISCPPSLLAHSNYYHSRPCNDLCFCQSEEKQLIDCFHVLLFIFVHSTVAVDRISRIAIAIPSWQGCPACGHENWRGISGFSS